MAKRTIKDIHHNTRILQYPSESYVVIDKNNSNFRSPQYCEIHTNRFGQNYIRFNRHTYYIEEE